MFTGTRAVKRITVHLQHAQHQEEAMMNEKSATMISDAEAAVGKAISGAEEMLTQAASATGDKAAELRGRALEQLKALRERLQGVQSSALETGKAAAQATDDYVHDNPWLSVVAAASLGVVIGILIARR
jgi:ElaB/YqjD/DUF883 family membrane-anchored ribosome-binding protein